MEKQTDSCYNQDHTDFDASRSQHHSMSNVSPDANLQFFIDTTGSLPRDKSNYSGLTTESGSGRQLLSTCVSYSDPTASALSDSRYSMGEPSLLCGLGKWRPKALQKLAGLNFFLGSLCCLACLCQALSTGYINSVITTIEKRFEIGSSTAGLIAASYEFGSLITVIFVSYLGGRRRIPVWIGTGVIIMSLGSFIFSMPQFLGESYSVQRRELNSNITKSFMCSLTGVIVEGAKASSPAAAHAGFDDPLARLLCIAGYSGNGWYVLLFILAQVFIGCGGTPIFTLGTTFLDDHLPQSLAAPKIAFVYAAGALGPILGYCMGAVMLQFYVDLFLFDYRDFRLHPRDPMWIGAWWGGFVLTGGLLLPLALIFCMFPRKLRFLSINADENGRCDSVAESKLMSSQVVQIDIRNDNVTNSSASYMKDWKNLPRSMLSLAKNKLYLITCLGICFEASIVSGFCVFLPKYLETQFSVSKSNANFLTGGIAIPGAVLGILFGGQLMQRYQLTKVKVVRLTLIMQCVSLVGFALLMWLGCNNIELAGATVPYSNSSNTSEMTLRHINLTSTCNEACSCSPNDLDLVCGSDKLTYFSPCYAGCVQFSSEPVNIKTQDLSEPIYAKTYSSCRCVNFLATSNRSSSNWKDAILGPKFSAARSGPCPTSCLTLTPFMCMLFLLTGGMSVTQMPLLMLTLRSVKKEERAFALGMQFVLLRVIAYIPAPIYFGKIIDSSCSHWKYQCGDRGACLMYDIVNFRLKYTGVSVILKIISILTFLLLYLLVRKHEEVEKSIKEEDGL